MGERGRDERREERETVSFDFKRPRATSAFFERELLDPRAILRIPNTLGPSSQLFPP
jgi:hypothetical protein